MTSVKTISTLLFCIALSACALGQESLLNQKVTIRFDKTSVADALDQLMKQTNTTINYRPSELPKGRTVSIDFQQVKMGEIIQEVWGDDVITLRVTGNAILVKRESVSSKTGTLEGTIKDENNEPLPGVSVRLVGTSAGNITDQNGKVNLKGIAPGDVTIEVSFVGYKTAQIQVKVKSGGTTSFFNQLEPSTDVLNEVVVKGISIAEEISLAPIKVTALDVKDFELQSVGAAEILKTSTGVVVRRSGGLGSNTTVNLNGLSGNAVRVYYDGFPLEYLGGGFDLANIPSGILDRIEVFKGVTPTEKGIDALAGGVNIVSKKFFNRDQLEISYQVGSFNTHRASALYGKKIGKRFSVYVKGFHNYSDNNFRMKNVRNLVLDSITDRFGNMIQRPREDTLDIVERFHNVHRSSFVEGGLSWIDLSWADELDVSGNYSSKFDEIQNGLIITPVPFTGVTLRTEGEGVNLKYTKSALANKLTFNYQGVLSGGRQDSDDASFTVVNWNREVISSSDSLRSESSLGQGGPIARRLERLNHAHRFLASYKPNERHQLMLTNFYARTRIKNYDLFNPTREINGNIFFNKDIPSFFSKNVAGLEWKGNWLTEKMVSVVFAKHYFYRAESLDINASAVNRLPIRVVSDKAIGYGGALKYNISNTFFVRFSYENTLRIPTEQEIFGNGVTVLSNFELRPERGDNFNLGINFQSKLGDFFAISTSLDGFFRDTKDLIWLVANGAASRFTNNRDTQTIGLEWSTTFKWNTHSSIVFNLTDQERTYQGFDNINNAADEAFIGTPLPNVPFFFYNVQWNLGIKSINDTWPNLSLYGAFFHIRDFSIADIPRNSTPDLSSTVPTQDEINLGLGYITEDNRLTLSLQVNNLTNNFELFDNWRVPKPNRNFQLKVNYQIF